MTFPRRLTIITSILFATLIQTQALQAHPPAPPLPLLFKETWKPTPTPAAVLLSQDFVANPNLLVTVYGNTQDVNSASGEPHVWTGMCSPACGVSLKLKDAYADLSGKAQPCRDQISSYNSNRNIGHIKAANNHADNLLSYVMAPGMKWYVHCYKHLH